MPDNFDLKGRENNILSRLRKQQRLQKTVTRRNVQLEQLSNVTDEMGDIDYRVKDANGNVRGILSAISLLEEFGVNAFFAGFDVNGDPTIYIDFDTGVVNLTQVNFGGSTLLEALVTLQQLGFVIYQQATANGETRVLRMGMLDNGTYPEGRIEFFAPGAEVTIPNGDFSSLDMSDWTETEKGIGGIALAALGDLDETADIRSLVFDGSGNLYAGGDTLPTSSVWKWDGSAWSAVGALSGGGVEGLAFDSGGDLFACGDLVGSDVQKWNGSAWSDVGTLDGLVRALVFDGSGDLYAGCANTVTGATVKKWNGSAWSDVGTISDDVATIAINGGNLYAGTTTNIQKWSGSAWSAVGTLSGSIIGIAFDGAGVLHVCGNLTGNDVQKWSGSAWSAVGTISGVIALAFDSKGRLFSGGDTGGNNLKILNGSTWEDAGTITGNVVSLIADANQNVYAGGNALDDSSVWKYAVTVNDWDASAGYASVDSDADTTVEFESEARFEVTAGEAYNFGVKSGGIATGGTLSLQVDVEFYTALTGGSLVSTETLTARSGASVSWTDSAKVITVPATATHAIFVARASADVAFEVWYDDFMAEATENFTALIFRDGGLYYVQPTGAEMQVDKGDGMLVSKYRSLSISTSELSVFSVTLPASALDGGRVHFEVNLGVLTGLSSLVCNLKVNGSTSATLTQTGIGTGYGLLISGDFFKTGTDTQTSFLQTQYNNISTGTPLIKTKHANTTVDDGAEITLSFHLTGNASATIQSLITATLMGNVG